MKSRSIKSSETKNDMTIFRRAYLMDSGGC